MNKELDDAKASLVNDIDIFVDNKSDLREVLTSIVDRTFNAVNKTIEQTEINIAKDFDKFGSKLDALKERVDKLERDCRRASA